MDGDAQQQRNASAKGRVEPRLAPLVVLALAAALVFLYGLGNRPLEDWDEAIYAQVAKEMARGGHWLTPHWEFQTWLEKPPLLMWTTALFFRLFGVTEFWARAASAFSGVGVVALVFLLGRHLYDGRVGACAALVLLTTYHFVSFSRFGTTDVMLTLFTYLALYAFVRVRESGLWWCVVWPACALGVMTKGAGGWVAPAAIIIALAFDPRRADLLRARRLFWIGLVLAILIAAPWHVLMYARHGQTFVEEYVGYHVLARIRTPLEGHAPGYSFYFLKIIDGFFPWCLLVPFAVAVAVRDNLRGDARSRILLITAALVFGAYTLVQSKLLWYIVPAYPALSLLVAALLLKIFRSARQRRKLKFAYIALGALLLIVGGVYTFILLRVAHPSEDSTARIAALAASQAADDREPLLLFSDAQALTRPAALFYSDRPLRQVYLTSEPHSPRARRYERPEPLSSVVTDAPLRIILRRDHLERLSTEYKVEVKAEADPFVYALIKRRSVGRLNSMQN